MSQMAWERFININETVYINWLLPASHFLWILGAAILLTMLAIALFQYTPATILKEWRQLISKPSVKIFQVIAFGLILAGLLVNLFKIPSPNLVVVKINPKASDIQLLPEISIDPHLFSPNDLKMDPMNKSHPINGKDRKDDLLTLFWDGHVSTSFQRFTKGNYIIRFQARGTEANREFAKIKIEFESPDTHKIMVTRNRLYIDLTSDMQNYEFSFTCPADNIGRIRITYFNDFQVAGTHKGRDVWIKEISLQKIN
jgi:hypothetical protein